MYCTFHITKRNIQMTICLNCLIKVKNKSQRQISRFVMFTGFKMVTFPTACTTTHCSLFRVFDNLPQL